MIEESARVVSIEGNELVLEAEIKTTCQSCAVQKGCGTSVLAKHLGRKLTRFRIANTVNAQVGDEVVVGLSEQAMLRGSLLVYLFPLLSMLFAALAVDALLPQVAGRDLLVALAAFTGLGLAVLALRSKLAGARSQTQLTPVALRKKLTVT